MPVRERRLPFVATTDVTLSSNEVNVAGGASSPDTRRPSASAALRIPKAIGRRSTRDRWEQLSVLERVEDICPSWRSNSARIYGQAVVTYATVAEMTVANEDKESVTSSGEEYVVEEYRSGDKLPTMGLRLVDGLGQKPARSHRAVKAVLSASNRFLQGSIAVPMQHGEGSFSNIEGLVPAGNHYLTVAFGEETAMESISITVVVRGCFIGEVLSANSLCESCSTTTYNFRPTSSFCQTCPEEGS